MLNRLIGRPSRPTGSRFWLACAGAMMAAAAPSSGHAQAAAPMDVGAALQASGKLSRDIRAFYAARGYQPLWLGRNGVPRDEAYRLIRLLESARLDGLDPGDYKPRSLTRALERAGTGNVRDLAKAEALLSRAFVSYVRDVRRAKPDGTYYVDKQLLPVAPSPQVVLGEAARAPSLASHLDAMPWMNPTYAGLRKALASYGPDWARDAGARVIRLNLARARALPGAGRGRYIVVDVLASRLTMYENGQPAGSMKVVVGKPEHPTPAMAALVRYAIINPYWNVPPDLVRDRIAPNVLEKGPGYVRSSRYELLSDWSAAPRILAPEQVNWSAIASGRQQLRVRQLPGSDNMMGRVKFMFPNELGIYLHDTPDKDLFRDSARRFSSGCVRLENAPALGRWLFGKPLPKANAPEQPVMLPVPVPVYLTYFTAVPSKQGVAFRTDVYGRDVAGAGKRERRLFAGL